MAVNIHVSITKDLILNICRQELSVIKRSASNDSKYPAVRSG